MFQLRKKRPPFGTEDSPIMEYAYSEQVKVVNGLCEVKHDATRNYLLKMGYEEVELEEALVVPSTNGVHDSDESLPPQPKPAKKKKRWR